MTSTAISSQGSSLAVSGGSGAAAAVTGIQAGFPTIIESTAHGFSNGDVVGFAGVGGVTGLNGNSYVVTNVTPNTYAIAFNSIGEAWTAGGTATPVSWTEIGNFKTIKGFDGKTSKLDATNLASLAKEYRAGLRDPGNFGFDVDIDLTDPGQLALQALLTSSALANFKLTLPNGHTGTFTAFVESFPWDGGVDKLLSASVNLIITGPVTIS